MEIGIDTVLATPLDGIPKITATVAVYRSQVTALEALKCSVTLLKRFLSLLYFLRCGINVCIRV